MSATAIGIEDIRAAARTLDGVATRTPVFSARVLSERIGADVLLKAENLQRTGSFKIRGSFNCISALSDDERARGVVAASAGNHAQGVALAARMLGVEATIFMPIDASMAKIQATRGYGARIELAGITFDDAHDAARAHAATSGATFVSPFDDDRVIAGQGTIGIEIAEQVPDADVVIVPCGGGGMLSGTALALATLLPSARVYGVQATGCAAFVRSLEQGTVEAAARISTIADGIAVKRPGERAFALVQRHVHGMVAVTDEQIVAAIALLLERQKLVVEGAGAVGVAALLDGQIPDLTGRRVVVVLSGGNIDLPLLQAVVRRGLTVSGRYLVMRTRILDRPGSLVRLLEVLTAERVNIVDIVHHREGLDIVVTDTEVELTVETRDAEHARQVLAVLGGRGYEVERIR